MLPSKNAHRGLIQSQNRLYLSFATHIQLFQALSKPSEIPPPPTAGTNNSAPDSLGGCMGIVFIGILMLFGIGFWAWIQSPQWFATLVNNRIETGVIHSSIPETEQTEIMTIVHEMTKRFEERTIVWKDLPDIIESVSKSEFAPIAFSIFIEATIISPSGLTDAEKKHAHQQLLRLQWAESNELIPNEKMDEIWSVIAGNRNEAKSIHLKNDLSDEEIRQFFNKTETTLDAFEVPLEPFNFDPSDALFEAMKPYLSEEQSSQPQ